MVGAGGLDWGRLLLRWPPAGAGDEPESVAPARIPATPPGRLTILLERAASTLALGRLIRRDAEGLERQIHRTVLTALLEHSRPVDEVVVRAKALGVPLDRRRLVGVAVRFRSRPSAPGAPDEGGPEAAPARLRDLAEAVSAALREAKLAGLASTIDEHCVGALIALPPGTGEDAALDRFARALRRTRTGAEPRSPVDADDLVVAAGSGVDSPREARRSLTEARQVAYAARHERRHVPVFRLPHVGLVGLLHLLREEPRVQTFVERELGPLLAYDAGHPKEHLLRTLRAYLDSGRNKSAAAAATHLSRPAFYERLARVGRILDVDLDSVEASVSLHVALLALDAIRDE
jgi:purine catabolism regulator